MKIDFDMLDRLVAGGITTASGLVAALREIEGKKTRKRAGDRARMTRKRGSKIGDMTATVGDIAATSPRHEATRGDKEREIYAFGRKVLGKNSGGLVSSLLKANGQDIAAAAAVIEAARDKFDPREYVAAACRRPPNGAGNPTMAAFDDLIRRSEMAAGQRGAEMRDITPGRDQGG